jgi:hypothetical protein
MVVGPPVPQQEQIEITDENAPALSPWTTPRLQRLSGRDAAKPWTPSFETTSSGPKGS